MNNEGRWNLSSIYDGFGSEKHKSDTEELKRLIGELRAFSSRGYIGCEKQYLFEYIKLTESIEALAGRLAAFASLTFNADTKNGDAASSLGVLKNILSGAAAPDSAIKKKIAEVEDLGSIIESSPELAPYKYYLMNIERDSKHLLTEGEEEVFAKLNISGAAAFSDMHSALTSGVTAKLGDEEMGLASIRNLAYSPDKNVRRDAYYAELACYPKIEDAIAFSLNSIKLQVLNECELRGYESPLAKTLYTSRMKKETLDALFTAIREYLPCFRKYLRIKAIALGYEGALPWYDLFAPLGSFDKTYTKDEAKEYLISVFSDVDEDICETVRRAFDDAWIDFYPRDGKVGGAFDYGVPAIGESRVLTNFDGSFSDIVTLAHELGHAFHDSRVFSHSVINQEYSMPVAETASTFNEVLVMDAAIRSAESKEERISLIENQLMDACQIITDIYSRFLFESAVFEKRRGEFLSAEKLSEIMLDAQREAYGDGLDGNYMHKYMWLCKGHYYSGSLSFYNFPYAFGGLFARGLFAKYKSEGKEFMNTYKKLLTNTSVSDIEECAAIANIDLTSPDFWRSGLKIIADEIDEFASLIEK